MKRFGRLQMVRRGFSQPTFFTNAGLRASMALSLLLTISSTGCVPGRSTDDGAQVGDVECNDEGCECGSGAIVPCHETLGSHAAVLECGAGFRKCENGVLTACQIDETFQLDVSNLATGDKCYDCDPTCKRFDIPPDASNLDGSAILTDSGITVEPGPELCPLDTDGDTVWDIADDCPMAGGTLRDYGCAGGADGVFAYLPEGASYTVPVVFTLPSPAAVLKLVPIDDATTPGVDESQFVKDVRADAILSGACGVGINEFTGCGAGDSVRFMVTLTNDVVTTPAAGMPEVFTFDLSFQDSGVGVGRTPARIGVPALGCGDSGAVGTDGDSSPVLPGPDDPCFPDEDGDTIVDALDECSPQIGTWQRRGCASGVEGITGIVADSPTVIRTIFDWNLPIAYATLYAFAVDDPTTGIDESAFITIEPLRVLRGNCVINADHFSSCDAGADVRFQVDVANDGVAPQVVVDRIFDLQMRLATTLGAATGTDIPVKLLVPREQCAATVVVGVDGGNGIPLPPDPGTTGCVAAPDADADLIIDDADNCKLSPGDGHLFGCMLGTPGVYASMPFNEGAVVEVSYTTPVFDRQINLVALDNPATAIDERDFVFQYSTLRVDSGTCVGATSTRFDKCSAGTKVVWSVHLANTVVGAAALPQVFDFSFDIEGTIVPVRVTIPPTDCVQVGGFGNDGSGTIGTGGSGACAGLNTECCDGIDNDGDLNVDGDDIHCTSALDDDEQSFATAIPGDNQSSTWMDCFYDGNSGSGDDGCRIHVNCLLGILPPSHTDCQLDQLCLTNCIPATTPNCDCFGCCLIGTDYYLLEPSCDHVSLSGCRMCVPNSACVNNCDPSAFCNDNSECDSGYCAQGCCVGGGTPTCAERSFVGIPEATNAMIVLDQSGSMGLALGGGPQTRWDAVDEALFDGTNGVISNLEGRVRFGMRSYVGSCSYNAPTTDGFLLNNRTNLKSFFDSQGPGGGTDTGGAIFDSVDWIVAQRALGNVPPGKTILIVMTDGAPGSICRASSSATQEAVDAVRYAYSNDIETFVVGIGLADPFLQEMANEGIGLPAGTTGPGAAPYWSVSDVGALSTAMSDTIRAGTSCQVETTTGIAGCADTTVELNMVSTPCDPANGWNPIDGTHLEFTGSYCDTYKNLATIEVTGDVTCPDAADPCATVTCSGGQVCTGGVCECPPYTFLMGGTCVPVPPPSGTYFEDHDAALVCNVPDEAPTWQRLLWDGDIPPGATIQFTFRASDSLANLATATPVASVTATSTTSQAPYIECGYSATLGTSDCRILVRELLMDSGIMVDEQFVRVEVTLTAASADPATYPTLYHMQMQTKCDAAQ